MSEGARTCLRCRVSPDVEHLRMLHEQVACLLRRRLPPALAPARRRFTHCWAHSCSAPRLQHWWLPSPEQIRPSAEVRAIKEATIEHIMGQYQSPVDFVLSSVFDAPATRGKVLQSHNARNTLLSCGAQSDLVGAGAGRQAGREPRPDNRVCGSVSARGACAHACAHADVCAHTKVARVRTHDSCVTCHRCCARSGATEEWSQESIQKVFTAYKVSGAARA